jgi:hypothetical protein
LRVAGCELRVAGWLPLFLQLIAVANPQLETRNPQLATHNKKHLIHKKLSVPTFFSKKKVELCTSFKIT